MYIYYYDLIVIDCCKSLNYLNKINKDDDL